MNSWLSTVLYHKIDPGSMSETDNSVAWTNVCFSEIQSYNNWICLCFHYNYNHSRFICFTDKEPLNWMRFPNTYHLSEKLSFPHCDLHPWQNSGDATKWLWVLHPQPWFVQIVNAQTEGPGPIALLLWVLAMSSTEHWTEQGLRAVNVSRME